MHLYGKESQTGTINGKLSDVSSPKCCSMNSKRPVDRGRVRGRNIWNKETPNDVRYLGHF